MKKFCCIGTHGTGKTTLTYQMAAYYKTKGKNVKLINETARSCPFPLNDQFNSFGAMWIIHTHIKKELEALARKADIIVCDRSPIDSIMYAQVNRATIGQQMNQLIEMANQWMETYDRIYYVRPNYHSILHDGIRSTNESFQQQVENEFDDWMEHVPYSIQNKIKIIPSSQIFQKENCWVDGNERL